MTLLDSYIKALKQIEETKKTEAERETAIFYYCMSLLNGIGDSFSSFEKSVCYVMLITQNKVHKLILLDKYAERCFFENKYPRCIKCYELIAKIVDDIKYFENPIFIKEVIKIIQIAGLAYFMCENKEKSKELFNEALEIIDLGKKYGVDLSAERENINKCLLEM